MGRVPMTPSDDFCELGPHKLTPGRRGRGIRGCKVFRGAPPHDTDGRGLPGCGARPCARGPGSLGRRRSTASGCGEPGVARRGALAECRRRSRTASPGGMRCTSIVWERGPRRTRRGFEKVDAAHELARDDHSVERIVGEPHGEGASKDKTLRSGCDADRQVHEPRRDPHVVDELKDAGGDQEGCRSSENRL